MRKVIFYGRVSTEHEAQLSALSNQIQWYADQMNLHKDEWELVEQLGTKNFFIGGKLADTRGKYIDQGITGTQAKNRTEFLKMIKEAKKQDFDLIVTREVCRFARNTVDALAYTRELKKQGIEVFFVNDNIWTFQPDAEFRLSIMAALAQEESKKISERVKAGQETSRQKGILYGSGNILGYDLKRNIDANGNWDSSDNTYIINKEQAETVRLIFSMYLSGMGTLKIVKELTNLKRKNAAGEVSWCASKISRILHNKTYAGYKCYNKSTTPEFLDHERKQNLDRDSYIYVKGDWEPIVSLEDWELVQKMMAEKTKIIQDARSGTELKIGKTKSEDVWLRKMRCSCGSSFRKNKWRVNKKSQEEVYGYQCYNQVNNGAASTRIKAGLSADGYCDVRMVADWKLDLMAKYIFEDIWKNKADAVNLVMDKVKEYYTDTDEKNSERRIKSALVDVEKNKRKLDALLELRLDGEITKEEYQEKRIKIEQVILELEEQVNTIQNDSNNVSSINEKMGIIKDTLLQLTDFSGGTIPYDVIEHMVEKIVPHGDGKFEWILNLSEGWNEVELEVEGRRGKGIVKKNVDCSQISTGCYRQ